MKRRLPSSERKAKYVTISGMKTIDERVKLIRVKAEGERHVVHKLQATLSVSRTPVLTEYLKFADHTLGDVETFFLGGLKAESRTPEQQHQWLDYAECALGLAASYRKMAEDIVAKFGPNIEEMPKLKATHR